MASLNREFFKDNVDACRDITICEIPNDFTQIDDEAFYDWKNCKYVIIPPTVKTISPKAFLWDNVRVVISNNKFFDENDHSFDVFPYLSSDLNSIIISMYERLDSIDSKVDIHSDDISSKREEINNEINNLIDNLNERKKELESKSEKIRKIYDDLSKKSDDNSQLIKDIKRKIDSILLNGTKDKLQSIKDEYEKYKSLHDEDLKLQNKSFEEQKEILLKIKEDIAKVLEEQEDQIDSLKNDFKSSCSIIRNNTSKLAEKVANEALEIVRQKTPYKVVNVIIDNKKYGSGKPKILHSKFEDVLKLVADGFNPLLVGPAGCGKNVIIEHVADTLGWKFYYCNDVTEEYKVMGFVDANGHYCKTQFFDAFTKGGFIMIDELDQSSASALLSINSTIGTGYHEYAAFPDGNLYNKHPDFHIAAAANTYGNGANMRYCGRNQLDSASLNRFLPVEIDYDRNLESNLVRTQDFLPLYWKIREIVDANMIRQVVSTRNIVNADKMISKNYDLNKIFDYTLVQGMSKDDLRIVLKELSKSNFYSGSYEDRFVDYLKKTKRISLNEY